RQRRPAARLPAPRRQRDRRARGRSRQVREPAAAVRGGGPELHGAAAPRLRSGLDHDPGQAPAVASGLRRGLPARRPPAARRHLDLTVAVSPPALPDALPGLVGPPHVLRDPVTRSRSVVDGVMPGAVVRPGRVEEVSRVLVLCASERLAGAPRGAGTTQELGNPPRRLDLVLDLGRLTAVREYVPEDMVATVETGLTLGGLAAHLAPHRQMLALDPPGGAARSVGGVLATHASGPLRFRYGTMRDLLLGVRFVQADGTPTWGGARVVKSVTGYDVPKLMVGALGTLAVLTELTLRLHPRPEVERSWLVTLTDVRRAEELLG